jgi:hypothetical protein
VIKKISCHNIGEWHKIMGHCNMKDILKLQDVVEGMKIEGRDVADCKTCTLGKMTQTFSRTAGKKADSVLALVHYD